MHQQLAGGVIGDRMIKVARDADGDIKSDKIIQAECRCLRASDKRSGNRVDFFHGIAVIEGVICRLHAGHRHESIADEIGSILAEYGTFTQGLGAKAHHEIDDFGIGAGVGDDLQKAQVARRIEEMCAEETACE